MQGSSHRATLLADGRGGFAMKMHVVWAAAALAMVLAAYIHG